MKKFLRKHFLFLILILATPAIWILLLHPQTVIKEIVKTPIYIQSNFSSMFSKEKIAKLNELKNPGGERSILNTIMPEFFYNKPTLVIDEFFNYVSYLSPRFFFQAGDGSVFSPVNTEPIAIVLFPAWLAGILVLFQKRKFRLLACLFAFAFLAYIIGQRNLLFLYPVLLTSLFIIKEGILSINNKHLKKNYLLFIALYGLFIQTRVLYFLFNI